MLLRKFVVYWLARATLTQGLQPVVHHFKHLARASPLFASHTETIQQAEQALSDILMDDNFDGSQQTLDDAIMVLQRCGGSIEVSALEGRWKLIYTSRSSFDYRSPLGRRTDGTAPGIEKIFQEIFGNNGGTAGASSSPIQRSVLSTPGIEATQTITLSGPKKRVEQCVRAGPLFLNLSASATFNETSGRIDFLFDDAYVLVADKIRIPYPVPFRLLGDEARGFLDTSYVSEVFRISMGNKGTTFILVRSE